MSLYQEFWARVDQGCNSECWPWTGSRGHDGYGSFHWQGRSWRAHRVAWLAVHGEIPGDACVLHHCDNPPCCNPEHLFVGTRADNNADRDAKGHLGADIARNMRLHPERRVRGENQGSAKLTPEGVRVIREAASHGWSRRRLAAEFGVSKRAIDKIVGRVSWMHV